MTITITGSAASMRAVAQAREAHAGELQPLLVLDDLPIELEATKRSGQFTRTGIQDCREQLASKGDKVLEAFEQGTARLTQDYQRSLDAAIDAVVPPVSESDAAVLLPWLTSKSRTDQIRVLDAAIHAEDWRTVGAVLRLPPSMSPIDDDVRGRMRARLLTKIPAASKAELETMQARLAARAHAEFQARRLLETLRGA